MRKTIETGFIFIGDSEHTPSLEDVLDGMFGIDEGIDEDVCDMGDYDQAIEAHAADLDQAVEDMGAFGVFNASTYQARCELLMNLYMTGQFFGMPTTCEFLTVNGQWINPAVIAKEYIDALKAKWDMPIFAAARMDHIVEYNILVNAANVAGRLWDREYSIPTSVLVLRISQIGGWLRQSENAVEFLEEVTSENFGGDLSAVQLDDFMVGLLWIESLVPSMSNLSCWDDFAALVDKD